MLADGRLRVQLDATLGAGRDSALQRMLLAAVAMDKAERPEAQGELITVTPRLTRRGTTGHPTRPARRPFRERQGRRTSQP